MLKEILCSAKLLAGLCFWSRTNDFLEGFVHRAVGLSVDLSVFQYVCSPVALELESVNTRTFDAAVVIVCVFVESREPYDPAHPIL